MYTKPRQDERPDGDKRAPLPRTLVTGASSGIGYALALQLAQAGVPVLALGRSRERLQALRQRCPQIDTVACDLADVAALPSLAQQWVARFPDLAVVIHNAGVQDNLRMDDSGYSAKQVRVEVDINLVAPMVLTQALLAHLQTMPGATIVNISSGLAFAPKRTSAVYSATKAGLHMFSQALRLQLRGSAIHVVEAVMPLVDTPMTQGRGKGKLSAEQAARQVMNGLRRHQDIIWVGKARALPCLLRIAPSVLAVAMSRM